MLFGVSEWPPKVFLPRWRGRVESYSQGTHLGDGWSAPVRQSGKPLGSLTAIPHSNYSLLLPYCAGGFCLLV